MIAHALSAGPHSARARRRMEFARRSCHDPAVSQSITIISVPADDPDSFEEMLLDERRNRSGGWQTFPLRSGRFLDSFLMKATGTDLGVFRGADDRDEAGEKLVTCLIDKDTLLEVLPELEALVETKADATAQALSQHGGGSADVARVAAALASGTWPTSGDPAEEAAAFAHQLLKSARVAKQDRMGVCWEYRGQVMV